MAIFNSFLYVYQRVPSDNQQVGNGKSPIWFDDFPMTKFPVRGFPHQLADEIGGYQLLFPLYLGK